MTEKPALIVLKRIYFDQFIAGDKTHEYRRHHGRFVEKNFWVGRPVRLAYRYQIDPYLLGEISSFEVLPFENGSDLLREIYPHHRGEWAKIGISFGLVPPVLYTRTSKP